MTEDEYNDIIEAVERAKQEKSQAIGVQKQLMKQLLDEFGCKTLDEAKEKLARLAEKKERLNKKAKLAYKKLLESMLGKKEGKRNSSGGKL